MKYLSSKDLAKEIRKDLKEEFGKTAKFSVRKHDYSGGRTIIVTIRKAEEQYFKTLEEFESYCGDLKENKPNVYEIMLKHFNRRDMVALKEDFVKKVEEISNKLNWDNSDFTIDYYDVNYYLDIKGQEIEVI